MIASIPINFNPHIPFAGSQTQLYGTDWQNSSFQPVNAGDIGAYLLGQMGVSYKQFNIIKELEDQKFSNRPFAEYAEMDPADDVQPAPVNKPKTEKQLQKSIIMDEEARKFIFYLADKQKNKDLKEEYLSFILTPTIEKSISLDIAVMINKIHNSQNRLIKLRNELMANTFQLMSKKMLDDYKNAIYWYEKQFNKQNDYGNSKFEMFVQFMVRKITKIMNQDDISEEEMNMVEKMEILRVEMEQLLKNEDKIGRSMMQTLKKYIFLTKYQDDSLGFLNQRETGTIFHLHWENLANLFCSDHRALWWHMSRQAKKLAFGIKFGIENGADEILDDFARRIETCTATQIKKEMDKKRLGYYGYDQPFTWPRVEPYELADLVEKGGNKREQLNNKTSKKNAFKKTNNEKKDLWDAHSEKSLHTESEDDDEDNLINKAKKKTINLAQKEKQKIRRAELVKFQKKLLLKSYTKIVPTDFLDDNFLSKLYLDFILQPNHKKAEIIGVGAMVNEIGHRLVAIEQLATRKLLKIQEPIKKRWNLHYFKNLLLNNKINEEKENQHENTIKWVKERQNDWNLKLKEWEEKKVNMKNAGKLKEILYKFLWNLVNLKRTMTKLPNALKNDWMILHLNWNKLAKAIAEDESLRIWWKLEKPEKRRALKILFLDTMEDFDTSISFESTDDEGSEIEEEGVDFDMNSLSLAEKFCLKRMGSLFPIHIQSWRKLKLQQLLDIVLLQKKGNNMNGKNTFNKFKYLMAEHYQQIDIPFKKSASPKEDEFLKLLDDKYNQLFFLSADDRYSKLAIQGMRDILNKWNKNAKLLVAGSYLLLDVHTQDSDIDAVVVVLEGTRNTLFGPPNMLCVKSMADKCSDDSFFCTLCQDTKVSELRKIVTSTFSLIEVNFMGIDFDLSFVSLPKKLFQLFPNRAPNLAKIDAIIKILVDETDQKALQERNSEENGGILRSLSGYRATKKMLNLIGNTSFHQKFRFTLLAIKLWAKRNHIYGGIFGFFNGINISVLVCKVFLMYPGATVPYLIEQFFRTILEWNWPTPLRLENSNKLPNLYWKWNPMKENESRKLIYGKNNYELPPLLKTINKKEMGRLEKQRLESHVNFVWPIITPGLPDQNASFNINLSTAEIIRTAVKQGFYNIVNVNRALKESQFDVSKAMDIWLEEKDFIQKYDHFLAVSCIANEPRLSSSFCSFAKTRMRVQIVKEVEAVDGIRLCHLKPEPMVRNAQCPKIIKEKLQEKIKNDDHFSNFLENTKQLLCTIWLVGVQFHDPSAADVQPNTADLQYRFSRFEYSIESAYDRLRVQPDRGMRAILQTYLLARNEAIEWMETKNGIKKTNRKL